MKSTAAGRNSEWLGHSACTYARRISRGEWTARDVVTAHIVRLQTVQAQYNPIAAERFAAALEEADQADRSLREGRSRGPLHGVPITIKECFAFQGMPTTLGLTHRGTAGDTQTDPLVARLVQAGAIVLAKTTVPQLMYYHETDNPVTGRTLNPWNIARVVGGSSGGEAAVIAAHGSPWGLGSDLGGSIRIPCHFCGIAGFKPTATRVASGHLMSNFRGLDAFVVQAGPMARYVEDLQLALQVLTNEPAESFTGNRMPRLDGPPVPWRAVSGNAVFGNERASHDLSGYRVGVCCDDGYFTPSAAIQRAVSRAAEALASQGATLVPFRIPQIDEALQIYWKLMTADGGHDLRQLTRGSRLASPIATMQLIQRVPRMVRHGLSYGLGVVGQGRWAQLLRATTGLSGREVWQMTYRRQLYRATFWQAWMQHGLHGLVCPPHALPAFLHGQSTDLLSAASHAFWPMLLGVPAGVVPVTRVTESEQTTTTRNGRDLIERSAARAEANSVGLPVGVQVIAPPWQDEVALQLMQAIEAHVEFPSGPS